MAAHLPAVAGEVAVENIRLALGFANTILLNDSMDYKSKVLWGRINFIIGTLN